MNKKIILIVCGLFLLFGFAFIFTACTKYDRSNPLDPGAGNYNAVITYTTNKVVLLADNFNSINTNIAPTAPWSCSTSGCSALIAPSGPDASHAIRFSWSGVPAFGDYAIVKRSCDLSGHFFVEYDMQYVQAGGMKIWKMSFRFTKLIGTINLLELGWQDPTGGANVLFYHTQTGGDVNLSSINPLSLTWYRFKIEVDTDSKAVKFWYKIRTDQNFTLLASLVENNLPSSITELRFNGENPGYAPDQSVNNIDNFEIYRFDVTQK